MRPQPIRVVFDVNVYLDNVLGDGGDWPIVTQVPPTTGNAAADCIALAFDGRFELYASLHIIRNVAAVMRGVGQSPALIERYVEAVVDVCEFSGGAIVDPAVTDLGIRDFEDNKIMALARSVDARIIVSSDAEFVALGPWHGRVILRPRDFVQHVVRERLTTN